MTRSDDTDILYNGLHRDDFRKTLQGTDSFLPPYVEDSIVRLHRIAASMMLLKAELVGPTLDVASGHGTLYRAIRDYFPKMLPYSTAELQPKEIVIDGEPVDCHPFHCDRDRLPLEDNSVGVILFCDVIEHLIVDPMWTLLEFNRVLRPNGHLIVTTPNAAGAVRAMYILGGVNPGREIEYKPTSIYQRHNREWTTLDLEVVLTCAGFYNTGYNTHDHLLDEKELELLSMREALEIKSTQANRTAGPEIFFSAQKEKHLTVDQDLPTNVRWPNIIYPTNTIYRRRPKTFPIVVDDDYT